MKIFSPVTAASFARRRSITRAVVSWRSASGLRLKNNRPWFIDGLKVEAPTADATACTAGSASTIAAARCWSSDIARNEMSVEASVAANTSPVSSCGK